MEVAITFRRLGLIVVTINYLAAAALIPARAVAGDAQADLVDFKYRADKPGGSRFITVRTVGTIINKSATHLEGRFCIRLHDEQGFVLEQIRSDDISLAPGQSDTATANERVAPEVWAQVASLKAYLGRDVLCSQGEALSPVVHVKTQNDSK